jgi:hypothetical protein
LLNTVERRLKIPILSAYGMTESESRMIHSSGVVIKR